VIPLSFNGIDKVAVAVIPLSFNGIDKVAVAVERRLVKFDIV
jgi:hypothetical protein